MMMTVSQQANIGSWDENRARLFNTTERNIFILGLLLLLLLFGAWDRVHHEV
jgi:hypothetical protein